MMMMTFGEVKKPLRFWRGQSYWYPQQLNSGSTCPCP